MFSITQCTNCKFLYLLLFFVVPFIGGAIPTCSTEASLLLTSSSTLNVEIGGTNSTCDEVDGFTQISVTGDVALDGHLVVTYSNGYQPVAGHTFEIISYSGNFSGAFIDVSFPPLTQSGLGWNVVYDNTNKKVRLSVVSNCVSITNLFSAYCLNTPSFNVNASNNISGASYDYDFFADGLPTTVGFADNANGTATIAPSNLTAGVAYKIALTCTSSTGICYYEQSFTVNPSPEVFASPITHCELTTGSGTSTFDLTFASGSSTPNVMISYHNFELNANQGTSPIANPASVSSGTSIKYVRVESILTGCFSVAPISLTVLPDPVAPVLSVATPVSGSMVCAQSIISATIIPGSGGLDCTDEVEYSVNNGGSWLPYTSGSPIVAPNVASGNVQIRARRVCNGVNCDGDAESFTVIASWNVEGKVQNTTTGEYFCTIQSAIDDPQTLAGHTLMISDGNYVEDVNVNKQNLTLEGASRDNTIIKGLYAAGGGATLRIGATSGNGATIKNLTISRDYQDWYNSTKNYGVLLSGGVSNVTLDGIRVVDNRNGVYAENNAELILKNSLIEKNRTGIHISNTVRGLVSNNIVRDNQTHGLFYNLDDGTSNLTNFQMHDNNFYDNWYSELTFRGSNSLASAANFECNFWGSNAPTVDLANPSEPGYAGIVPQQLGGVDPTASGATFRGNGAVFIDFESWRTNQAANGSDPFVPTGNCDGTPVIIANITADHITCGEMTGGFTINYSGGSANYTVSWTGAGSSSLPPSMNLSAVATGLSAGTYVVTVTDGNGSTASASVSVEVLPVTNITDGNYFATIQEAIDDAGTGTGDVIEICPGTYLESVAVTKSIHLKGKVGQVNNTIIMAPSTIPVASNPESYIVKIAGSGVDAEISELTIKGPGPGGCGIIAYGILVRDGANADIHDNKILDIRDNPFSGCQNGIGIQVGRQALSTSGTATITNNIISGYQKNGITVDGTGSSATISGNTITGIGTTTIIAQNGVQISRSATGTLSGNTISGNSFHVPGNPFDYGSTGILLYQSGAVSLNAGNDLSGNDNNLYIFENSGMINIGGAQSFTSALANHIVNYGTSDLDLRLSTFDGVLASSLSMTGLFDLEDKIYHAIDNGSLGFVYVKTNNAYVTPESFDTGNAQIQRGIDAASDGFTVNVRQGNYGKQIAENRSVFGGGGSYQFGLFVDKNNLTIKGFGSGDAEVSNAMDALVSFTTGATNNFGASGIFVQGNGVTLTGLKIGDNYNASNALDNNKTIEVVGDAFTMQDCWVNTMSDEGAIYFGRWDGSHPVNTYSIVENKFTNALISINNGVGISGLETQRVISNNTFEGTITPYIIGFRGWNGGSPVQGWIVDPVGGAIVTGNTFDNTGVQSYILARGNTGGYISSQLDWSSIWNNNTYGNHVIALQNEGSFDPRIYNEGGYTASRRISPFIQENVNIGQSGDVVLVSSGLFEEDVLVNKALELRGSGFANTTIEGQKGGDGATVRISAAGAKVNGFTITREGNNVSEWNDATLNNAGVAVQGQSSFGEIFDNRIYGNRTGIDINNSNGNHIHNNIIENNHTGMIFRNQTDNTILEENFIIDNRTVGVLFLDASSGTNSPVQTALNSQFNDNNISGNWYGEIVDRQAGGSLPVPGANMKNFECNWYGTTSPMVSTANSGEPGYASLIPSSFGGSATPPGGQPDILGPASANFDYVSWLVDGSDMSGVTPGFQPVSGACTGTLIDLTNITTDHITCGDAMDEGKITLTFSGGMAPYDIVWTGGSANGISSPYEIIDLNPGNYTFTITDANGSSVSGSAEIEYLPVSVGSEFFATIQEAIDAPTTGSGDIINVCAGTYAENIVVNKEVKIYGPNAAISPNTGSRSAEAIVVPATSGADAVFVIEASNVEIKGFIIDGDNTTITTGWVGTNGADIDAYDGIVYYDPGNTIVVNGLKVHNNIIRNTQYFGIDLFGWNNYNNPTTSGHEIVDNKFEHLGTYNAGNGYDKWGGGVLLYNDNYANISSNVMEDVRIGIQTGNFHDPNTGGVPYQTISDNTMQVRRRGVFYNLHTGNPSPWTINNNTITALSNANETVWDGILLSSLSEAAGIVSGNMIDGSGTNVPSEGIEVWNVKDNAPALISGGMISGVDIGVYANNFDGYISNAGNGAHAALSNINIQPKTSGTGVKVADNPSSSHAPVVVQFNAGVVLAGGTNGVVIENASASVGGSLNNLSLNGQSGDYIQLINNTGDIDATSAFLGALQELRLHFLNNLILKTRSLMR